MLDMETCRAIVLGVVQGITEFLPISSDGHLVLAETLLDRSFGVTGSEDTKKNLELVLALHVGTLVSIIIIYWKDLIQLPRQPRLCGLIILATIPAGVVGLLLKDKIEETFNSPLTAGVGFLITAGALLIGQRAERMRAVRKEDLTPMQALFIGCCQTLALLPGVSRSGSTIAAGLSAGLERTAAARFSFLMAVPVIGGATLLMVKDMIKQGHASNGVTAMIVGAVTAAVVGYFALSWLLRMVTKGKLHWFAYYCIALGLITIGWSLAYPKAPTKPTASQQAMR